MVEQILLVIIIEGYIDLKSKTTIQGSTPDSTSWTYPPAIWSCFPNPWVFGTATPFLSARRITRESIHLLVVLVDATSTVVSETEANASFLAIEAYGSIVNTTPLGLAISSGKTELAIELITKGANVNTSFQVTLSNGTIVDRTPLGMAIFKNQSEVANALIEGEADVNKSFQIVDLNLSLIHI